MNQPQSDVAPPQRPPRSWWLWVLFVGSLAPLALIAFHWNAVACAAAVLTVAVWLAIGFKYFNYSGFVDPFDFFGMPVNSGITHRYRRGNLPLGHVAKITQLLPPA